jgi:hypothetical protein
MCVVCSAKYATIGGALLLASTVVPPTSIENGEITQLQDLQSLSSLTADLAVPDIEEPQWLQEKKAVQAAAAAANRAAQDANMTVRYSVMSRGVTTADMAEFSTQVNQTLNDGQGWARLGVAFEEVASGGNFIMVLSSSDQMTSFSSGCSALWSCRVGQYVIINQDRWLDASEAWYQGGGSLRDYRHSVVNHEVGHWLGHDHATCDGPGQPAKVMQQQSIDLQGCVINPWPLASELWSTQLGIDRR